MLLDVISLYITLFSLFDESNFKNFNFCYQQFQYKLRKDDLEPSS